MSATTAGALKALLEAAGLGVSVHRDAAPDGAVMPYITVSEGLATTPLQHGDVGDAAADTAVAELAQVDVWQAWRTPEKANAESYTLVPAVVKALHGAKLPTAPTVVHGMTVDSSVRLLERDSNTVHQAITVRIRRRLM